MSAVQLMAQINSEAASAASGKMEAVSKQSKVEGIHASFSNYMQQTASNGAQTSLNGQGVKQTESRTQPSESVHNEYEQYRSESSMRADKVNSTQDGMDTKTVDVSVEEAAQEIKDVIAEELGVDEALIEAAMQMLGLTAADLLNPQNLMALTMELTGNQDAAMMLFQEDFQNILQQVSKITEDLLEDLGMSMEELQTKLQQMEVPVQDFEEAPDVNLQEDVVMQAESDYGTVDMKIVENNRPLQQEETVVQTEVSKQNIVSETKPVAEAEPDVDLLKEDVNVQTSDTPKDDSAPQEEFSNGRNAETFRNEAQEQHHTFAFQADTGQNVQTPVSQDVQQTAPMPQIDVQDIIDQIVRYVRVNVTETVKSLEMQLNPENLGKIYLHISEHEGSVTAHLTAQNEGVKEALVQQMAVLRENLEQQGVKVDAVEVSVGTHEFEQNLEKDARQQEEQAKQQEEREQRRSRRSIRLDDLDELSGLMSEEDALVAQIMRDNGNNVDYRA